MQIVRMLESLKPWQWRVMGGVCLIAAAFPLTMQYNYLILTFREFGSGALATLLAMYWGAVGAWMLGFMLIGRSLEEHYLLIGDSVGKGVLLIANCFMMGNFFPEREMDRPVPEFAFLGSFLIPLAGSALHFIVALICFWPEVAARIWIDRILMGGVVIVSMGYILGITDFLMYAKHMAELVGWDEIDLYRILLAEAVGVTMVTVMWRWGLRLESWDWGERDE